MSTDTPAWVVTKCNQYARDHGLAQFVVYQGKWSIAERDFERDILDMVRSEGMVRLRITIPINFLLNSV